MGVSWSVSRGPCNYRNMNAAAPNLRTFILYLCTLQEDVCGECFDGRGVLLASWVWVLSSRWSCVLSWDHCVIRMERGHKGVTSQSATWR